MLVKILSAIGDHTVIHCWNYPYEVTLSLFSSKMAL